MLPADERLQPGQPAGGQLDDRLVMDSQLSVVDRPPQGTLRLQPNQCPRPHVIVEQLGAVPTSLLGPVHGRVGVSEQGVGGVMGRRRGQGDADTGGDADLPALEGKGWGERLAQALGDHQGLALVVQILAEHHELVAPEAGHRVAGADDGSQPLGGAHQQFVAGGVAEAVVDQLEPVDVEE